MKKGVMWTVIMLAISSVSLGVWNPNTDPNLVFNLDFESNTSTTTTDSVSSLVGVVELCTDANGPWEVNDAKFGYSGDFRNPKDQGGTDDTSSRISLPPNLIWDLGYDANTVRTFALWFGYHDGAGTFIGQANVYEQYANAYWWQFRLRDGRIAVQMRYDSTNALFMRTAQNIYQLGITFNDWYHVAAVIDRRTRYGSKIYLNGAPVEVEIVYHNYGPAGVDPTLESPVYVGGGEDDYDGLLDEIRLYHRILDDTEVSLLYQWAPGKAGPYGLAPLPNHVGISTNTGLSWEPISGATDQTLYFGTDPGLEPNDPNTYDISIVLSGSADSQSNEDIDGPLDFETDYYWMIVSTVSGSPVNGPVWKFTSDPGFAINPQPADGQAGIPIDIVDLGWTGSPDAVSFDVYFSDVESKVQNNDPNVLVADNIADSNVAVFSEINLPEKGKKYFWRVNTNFTEDTIEGNVWNFRASSNEIVINTSDIAWTYNTIEYPAKTMTWADTSEVINGTLGTDDVVIFNIDENLNITDDYDVIVIPLFTNTVEDTMIAQSARPTSRPMAIHVDGDVYIEGRINISGEFFTADQQDGYSPFARCGGYRGPRDAGSEPIFATPHNRELGSYTPYGPDTNDRFWGGSENTSKYLVSPSAQGFGQFGPGAGSTAVYCVGGGAGYGGVGGEAGRGWLYGHPTWGLTYGDKEVPVPFGGSGGGFGKKGGGHGGSGGGGVEIYATGNITFGPNAEIKAEGGNSFEEAYAGGGGSGGSVRIIADGNFANAGIISANGGKGGDATGNNNNVGGGGGGGRIAIWYGGDYSNTGSITANGGAAGYYGSETRATPGRDGTIFISDGLPKKASAPTPRSGDKMVYVGTGSIPLKWYSGFGGTSDQVYFGTNPNPTTPLGSAVSATRGEHTSTVNASIATGQTYYWKVVTDGTVSSDVWSFTVVNWQCNISNFDQRPQWDSGPYCDCLLDFKDFAYFAQFWLDPDRANMGPGQSGIQMFINEWLKVGGRTP